MKRLNRRIDRIIRFQISQFECFTVPSLMLRIVISLLKLYYQSDWNPAGWVDDEVTRFVYNLPTYALIVSILLHIILTIAVFDMMNIVDEMKVERRNVR